MGGHSAWRDAPSPDLPHAPIGGALVPRQEADDLAPRVGEEGDGDPGTDAPLRVGRPDSCTSGIFSLPGIVRTKAPSSKSTLKTAPGASWYSPTKCRRASSPHRIARGRRRVAECERRDDVGAPFGDTRVDVVQDRHRQRIGQVPAVLKGESRHLLAVDGVGRATARDVRPAPRLLDQRLVAAHYGNGDAGHALGEQAGPHHGIDERGQRRGGRRWVVPMLAAACVTPFPARVASEPRLPFIGSNLPLVEVALPGTRTWAYCALERHPRSPWPPRTLREMVNPTMQECTAQDIGSRAVRKPRRAERDAFSMIHNRVLLAVLAAAMLPISAAAQSSPRPPSLVPAASGRPVEVELRAAVGSHRCSQSPQPPARLPSSRVHARRVHRRRTSCTSGRIGPSPSVEETP